MVANAQAGFDCFLAHAMSDASVVKLRRAHAGPTRNDGQRMERRTVVVEGPLAYRMRRYDAARGNETGLEILTFPQVAERLAGGFARAARGLLLYTAVDTALQLDGYADLERVKHLPGMARAVVATLTAAWNADVDLEGMGAAGSTRLADLALLQRRVRDTLPSGVLITPELRSAALARRSIAKQIFGSMVLEGIVDLAPVWRPLMCALVEQLEVKWAAPQDAVDRTWFRGNLNLKPLERPPSITGEICADPRSEVVEALRWARMLLARGEIKASDVAIVAASPAAWDEHFLVLATEANLPIHFSHGIPALSVAEGQACAALADVLTGGIGQDRIRRLMRRLPKTETLSRIPADWSSGLPRSAGLFNLDQWRQALRAARAADAAIASVEPALLPVLELLARGVEAAAEAGSLLLKGESLVLWDEALRIAPPAAVSLTLETLRVPDHRDPANSIVWSPASHFVGRPRPWARLLGLSGRSWPRSESEDALLPDHILPRRVLVPVSISDRDRQAFDLVCGQAANGVVLSRSVRSAEGSLLSKSPLWPDEVATVVHGRTRVPEHAFSETDRLLARPQEAGRLPRMRTAFQCWQNRRKQELTVHDGLVRASHPAVARALARVHSTTSLKRLLRDPLGFVWQYALGWRSPEYSKQPLDIDPLAFGELIHEILRRTVSALEPTPGFARATSDEIEAALSASMELIGKTWPLERPVPPGLLWEHTLQEAARRSLRGLTVEEPLQGSTRSWTELAFGHFGAPDDPDAPWQAATEVGIGDTGLRFGGRMDRVDIRSDRSSVGISDYKSGAAPKNADRIVLSQGRELQRVLYALAVRQLVPDSTVVARLVYLKDESSPISLRGGALDAAIGETVAFVETARRLVEAGSAFPGPDAKDEYNDMRLAHPADLDGYLQNKQAAFATASRDLSRLWSRP